MKALSLWQPFASLIACGAKTIETRGWSTSYRGPLAIHAAKRVPTPERGPMFVGDFHVAQGGTWLHGPEYDEPMPFGAIVATCVLADCIPADSHWSRVHTHRRGVLFRDHRIFGGPRMQLRLEGDEGPSVSVVEDDKDGLWLCASDGGRGWVEGYVEDQLPYGDWSDGRWAWMLTDIMPTVPTPARGRQGLWNWTP